MNDGSTMSRVANPPEINKERLQWGSGASGTRWFLEKFPGVECSARFYNALRDDRRYARMAMAGRARSRNRCRSEGRATGFDHGRRLREDRKQQIVGRQVATTETGRTPPRPAKGERRHDRRRANAATTGYRANAPRPAKGERCHDRAGRTPPMTEILGERRHDWLQGERCHDRRRANAATTGCWANGCHDRKLGERRHDRRRGERRHDRLQGERCHDRKLGERCHDRRRGERATTGEHAVAAALGIEGEGRPAAPSCLLPNYDGELIHIRASKVGENGVKRMSGNARRGWRVLWKSRPDHEQHSPAFPRGAGAFRPRLCARSSASGRHGASEDINVMAYTSCDAICKAIDLFDGDEAMPLDGPS